MSRASAPAAVRWTAYIGIAVVFAIACAFLSNWQFARNAERARQLALVEANFDAAPVALDALVPEGSTLDPADEWRPVTLTGTYLVDRQLLARNRPHGGTAAFEVLVPLRLSDGRVLLIDRGWVPPGASQPDPDVVPTPPAGQVTVIARLRPGEPLPGSGRSAPEGQVPSIHLPLIASTIGGETGERMDLSAFGVLVSEQPAPAGVPQPLEAPSDDPGPHLSYAVQWILFALLGFIFIAYVIRSERRHSAQERAGAEGDAAPPHRGGRKPDADAAAEDALLDDAQASVTVLRHSRD